MLFETTLVALGAEREHAEPLPFGPSFDIDRMCGAPVLLVEDNKINQEVAIWQLEDAEAFVDLAENGEVALTRDSRQQLRRCADGHTDAHHGWDTFASRPGYSLTKGKS